MSKPGFSIYDEKRNVKIPKHSKKLAEFMGIMFGDGSILERGRKHKISISLNMTEDKFYLEYITKTITHLFNINPRLKFKEHWNNVEIEIYSKAMSQFLINAGFPHGRKDFTLKIPSWILAKSESTKSFIKGLADTDGSLFFAKRGTYRENVYPVIEIKLHNNSRFIENLSKVLRKLGFSIYTTDRKIQINGKEGLMKWMEEIGFENMNQLSRYLVWKKFKYCPPKTNISKRLEMLGWQKPLGL